MKIKIKKKGLIIYIVVVVLLLKIAVAGFVISEKTVFSEKTSTVSKNEQPNDEPSNGEDDGESFEDNLNLANMVNFKKGIYHVSNFQYPPSSSSTNTIYNALEVSSLPNGLMTVQFSNSMRSGRVSVDISCTLPASLSQWNGSFKFYYRVFVPASDGFGFVLEEEHHLINEDCPLVIWMEDVNDNMAETDTWDSSETEYGYFYTGYHDLTKIRIGIRPDCDVIFDQIVLYCG